MNKRNAVMSPTTAFGGRPTIAAGLASCALRNSYEPGRASSQMAMLPGSAYGSSHGRAMSTVANSHNFGNMNTPYKPGMQRNIFYSPRNEEINYENTLKDNGERFKTIQHTGKINTPFIPPRYGS